MTHTASVTHFLTSALVARQLGVTPAQVRQLARRGHLRVAATTAGGTRLYDPNDVADLLAERMSRRREAA